jgi:hypothetical protein
VGAALRRHVVEPPDSGGNRAIPVAADSALALGINDMVRAENILHRRQAASSRRAAARLGGPSAAIVRPRDAGADAGARFVADEGGR